MNATMLARTAYATQNASIRTAKDAEYDTFARVTAALKNASDISGRAEALHRNRTLWTILATDVANSENTLPAELRARIFYLAEFTNQHSSKVLDGTADMAPLVEINTAMMRGLRAQGAFR